MAEGKPLGHLLQPFVKKTNQRKLRAGTLCLCLEQERVEEEALTLANAISSKRLGNAGSKIASTVTRLLPTPHLPLTEGGRQTRRTLLAGVMPRETASMVINACSLIKVLAAARQLQLLAKTPKHQSHQKTLKDQREAPKVVNVKRR